MAQQLEPIQSPDDSDNPNWTLILLTGVVALMAVLGAGLLVRQLVDAYQLALATDTPAPSDLPSPTATLQAPALALQIPGEGHWRISLTLDPQQGATQIYEEEGTGSQVRIPQVEQPLNSTMKLQALLEIRVLYPLTLAEDAPLQRGTLSYSSLRPYQAALDSPLYALYDAAGDFLRVADRRESLPPNLEIRRWSAPDPLPTALASP